MPNPLILCHLFLDINETVIVEKKRQHKKRAHKRLQEKVLKYKKV